MHGIHKKKKSDEEDNERPTMKTISEEWVIIRDDLN